MVITMHSNCLDTIGLYVLFFLVGNDLCWKRSKSKREGTAMVTNLMIFNWRDSMCGEGYIWRKHYYNTRKGKWRIAVIVNAGYGALDDSDDRKEMVDLEHGIYFHNLSVLYPESVSLLPEEVVRFYSGLKIVSRQIAHAMPNQTNTVIKLRGIQFSDCAIQEEAFTAAAIEWASGTFHFKLPDYKVVFDDLQGKYGRYVYDFSGI